MLAWEQHLKELPGRPSSSSSFSSLQLHENFSLKFSPPGFGIKLHHHKQFAVTLTALGKWEQYGRQRKKTESRTMFRQKQLHSKYCKYDEAPSTH